MLTRAGALGDWDGAMVEYVAAAKDASMKDIVSISTQLHFKDPVETLLQPCCNLNTPTEIPWNLQALANYALALFQTGQDQAALKEAKQLVRRDPQFWDMRAATVAL
jgi:hypothetical protein